MKNNHWDEIYKLAKQYYNENGNLLIPFRYATIDKIQLGRWIGTQRGLYKENNISKERIDLLVRRNSTTKKLE